MKTLTNGGPSGPLPPNPRSASACGFGCAICSERLPYTPCFVIFGYIQRRAVSHHVSASGPRNANTSVSGGRHIPVVRDIRMFQIFKTVLIFFFVRHVSINAKPRVNEGMIPRRPPFIPFRLLDMSSIIIIYWTAHFNFNWM